MPTLQEWFTQHKTAVYVGAGATGIIVFVILSRQNNNKKPAATLDTLHNDLTSIDKRLQAENSYLSSSASMSPLSPGIDVVDIMAPGATTERTPSTPAPKAITPKPPVKTDPKKKGKGVGDYGTGGQDFNEGYAFPGTFGYGGDANDYWSLN